MADQGTELAVAEPTMSELKVIESQCAQLARSDLCPQAYRGKPNNIFHVGMMGRRFGWDVSASMDRIHVIQGKPTLSADAMLGLILQRGHTVTFDASDEYCTASGIRCDTGAKQSVTWDMAMAERADLTKNPTWRRYPRAMLRSRAVSELGRMLFSDVLLGLIYVPEELGAEVELHDDGSLAIVDPPAGTASASARPASVDEARLAAKRGVLQAAWGDAETAKKAWAAVVSDETDLAQLEAAPEAAEKWLARDFTEIDDAEVVDAEAAQ